MRRLIVGLLAAVLSLSAIGMFPAVAEARPFEPPNLSGSCVLNAQSGIVQSCTVDLGGGAEVKFTVNGSLVSAIFFDGTPAVSFPINGTGESGNYLLSCFYQTNGDLVARVVYR